MKKLLLSIVVSFLIAFAMGQSVFTVTKTTDPDPFLHRFNNVDSLCDPEMYGTLQWAINKVNLASDSSVIEFDITGFGVQEIFLNQYLPQIRSSHKVVINGKSQSASGSEYPEIKITGQFGIDNCFDVYQTRIEINGLYISGFESAGIKLMFCDSSKVIDNVITDIWNTTKSKTATGIFIGGSNSVEIKGNSLGLDPLNLSQERIKNYGLFIEKSNACRIGDTSNSGVNSIANSQIGVYIYNGIYNEISGNSIYDNSKNAIYLGTGANQGIGTPVINAYNGMLSGIAMPNAEIEVFGSTGSENANQFLIEIQADQNGSWETEMISGFSHYCVLAHDVNGNTSELSNSIINADNLLGSSCENSINLFADTVSSIYRFYGDTIWFSFQQDSLLEFFDLYESSDVALMNIRFFTNSCVNLVDDTVFVQTDSVMYQFSGFTSNQDYYVRIIAEEDCCLQVNTRLSNVNNRSYGTCNLECPEVNNLVRNGDFDVVDPLYNSLYAFQDGDVCGWARAFETPSIFSDNGNLNCSMWSCDDGPWGVASEGITTKVRVCEGEYYKLTLRYKKIEGGTGNIKVQFGNSHSFVNVEQFGIGNQTFTTNSVNSSWQSQSFYFYADDCYGELIIFPWWVSGEQVTVRVDDVVLKKLSAKDIPDQEICQGESVQFNAYGCYGNDYAWTPTNGLSSPTSGIVTASPQESTQYTLVVTDPDGCTATSTTTVEVLPAPETTLQASQNPICSGEDVLLNSNVSGGTLPLDFHWSSDPDWNVPQMVVSPITTTTYGLTVTGSNGCSTTDQIVINVDDAPILSLEDIPVDPCNSTQMNIDLQLSGGVPPFIYQWSNGASTQDLYNVSPGTYSVTVSTGNGCVVSETINANHVLIHLSNIQVFNPCFPENDGSVHANFTGANHPLTLSWEDEFGNTMGSGLVNTVQENLAPGTYYVTATDDYGCTADASATLIYVDPPELEVVINEHPCGELDYGSATVNVLNPTGSYDYLWSNGATTATVDQLQIGSYAVTVTDDNSCFTIIGFEIEDGTPQVTAEVNVSCELCTNSIGLNVTGVAPPYSYIWSNGGASNPQENLCSGHCQITTTDASGCSTITEVFIPSLMEISVTGLTGTCAGESDGAFSIDVTGGVHPVNINITNSNGDIIPELNGQVSGVSGGVYNVEVSDANCTQNITVEVEEFEIPIISIVDVLHVCDGQDNGTATADVLNETGLYTFLWDNGENTQTANQLGLGTHSVTVTNENGCTSESSVIIEDETPSAFFKIIGDCHAVGYQSIEFLIINYDPVHTYEWDFGDGTIEYTTGQSHFHSYDFYGYYCVTLTASYNGCISTQSERIFVDPDECACSGIFPYGEEDLPYGMTIHSGENVQWGFDRYVDHDVVIENGGYLLIKGTTIHFGPQGRIIVEGGGVLEVFDATLTNFADSGSCNNMWQGIECFGNGEVTLLQTNVKNAHNGIYVGKKYMDYICEGGQLYNPWNADGILSIKRTNFIDCGVGIRDNLCFQTYEIARDLIDVSFSSTGLSDPGYYSNYPDPYDPSAGTGLRNPWAYKANALLRTKIGIQAHKFNTKYTIDNNSFSNLDIGIEFFETELVDKGSNYENCIYGVYIKPLFSSDHANFISNSTFNLHPGPFLNCRGAAIYTRGTYGDVIENNTFGNTFNSDQSDNDNGVVMIYSSGYRVRNNTFELVKTGIRASNSGTGGGYLGIKNEGERYYGNDFIKCWRSIYTIGDNPALKIRCNRCNNPDEYIYDVNFYNGGNLATQGITPFSSSNVFMWSPRRKPAGNQFLQNEGFHNYTYHEIQSSSISNSYLYVHHDEDLGLEPWKIMPKAVWHQGDPSASVNLLEYHNAEYKSDDSCYPVITFEPLELDYTFSAMQFSLQQADSISEILDNGNTNYLIELINNHHSGDRLSDILCMNSPLSDTVLQSFMMHDSVSDKEFCMVLSNNTPVCKNNESAFYYRVSQLPYDDQEKLWELQAYNENCQTQTACMREYEIYNVLYRQIFSELYRSYIQKEDEKGLIGFLDKYDDNLSQELKLGIYLKNNDSIKSRQVLNAYQPETVEDSLWKDYMNIFVENLENGDELYYLSKSNLMFVNMLADHCEYGRANVYAQNLLSMLYGYEYAECDYTIRSARINKLDKTKDDAKLSIGNPFPNPATRKIFIPYKSESDLTLRVEIHDLAGRFIDSQRLDSGNQVLELNVKNYVSGMYQVKFVSDSGSVKSVKFIKQ